MKTLLRPLALIALAATPLALAGPSEKASSWPDYDLEVIHPVANSFSAFEGRAVLIEFFAHW